MATFLFALLALTARADEIFNVRIDIIVNECHAHGPCKAEHVGPFDHSIVMREKPEGLQGLYEWFDRVSEGYYVSVRVTRAPGGSARVQAYVANGDGVGAAASVSAWVADAGALNRLQFGPPPRKQGAITRDISLTLN